MKTTRRNFIQKTTLGTAGIILGGIPLSAKSYKRILGANDRIHVGIVGLGRRLGGFSSAICENENNVNLSYLCDLMPGQI